MQMYLDERMLSTIRVPQGRARLTVSDKACPGLSIELRNPGGASWRVRYSYEKIQHCLTIGKVRDVSLDEARQIAYAVKKLLAAKKDPAQAFRLSNSASCPTFSQFIENNYLPHINSYKRCVSADKTLLDNHLIPIFGHLKMNQITRYQIVEFMQSKITAGYKPGYCNRFLVLLGFCFNLAIKWEVPGVKHNPVKGVDRLRNFAKKERFLQAHELEKLLFTLKDSPNPLLQYLVPLALLTGARKRELLDARWRDIDFVSRVWHIPFTKSGRPLDIPLTTQAYQLLQHLQNHLPTIMEDIPVQDLEWVFPNPKTNRPYVSIFNAWNSARNKAGLPDLRIHDLRHSFASALVNQGVPIYDVQKLLGHQNIKTTERYSHLSPERLRQSASAASMFYANLIPTAI